MHVVVAKPLLTFAQHACRRRKTAAHFCATCIEKNSAGQPFEPAYSHMAMISAWQREQVPNPTEAFMNSAHEIETTEENPAPAEAIESASETILDDAAAAAVEAADLSDDEGDDEHSEATDEEGVEGEEAATLSDEDEDENDDAEDDDSVRTEAVDAGKENADEKEESDEESDDDAHEEVAA